MSNEQHEVPIQSQQTEPNELQAQPDKAQVQKEGQTKQSQEIVGTEEKKDDIEIEKGIQQIKGDNQVPERKLSTSSPVIINPIYYYKGHEKFEWRIDYLEATSCLEKLERKPIEQIQQIPLSEDVSFELVGSTNIKGHIFYNVKVRDQKGERQISRRYTEYLLWRNKLLEMWPCVILAALPSKTIMGVSEDDLVRSRSKYIIRFLRSINKYQALRESEEVQVFLQESQSKNWESVFQQMGSPKYPQLLQKYKKHFTDEYVFSQREQFMYKKDQMPLILEQYQSYFSSKKMDLMDYGSSLRRMAESKQNYFKALNKLNSILLPDYQDTLYRWMYAEPLPDPSSIQKSVQQGEEEKDKKSSELFGLYSSQAYKAKLEQTLIEVKDFNLLVWKIYDPIKFELKEIDSVIGAIEQAKNLQRDMQYLQRTININKEQIQSLNSNKTTLKTFFMEGNSDDKKTRLTNDNHIIEEQLEKYTQLYYILMVLLEKQLEEYHKSRANFYKNSVNQAFSHQLQIVKSTIDFHIYEQQLFAKERLQRVQLLKEDLEQEIKQKEKEKQIEKDNQQQIRQ